MGTPVGPELIKDPGLLVNDSPWTRTIGCSWWDPGEIRFSDLPPSGSMTQQVAVEIGRTYRIVWFERRLSGSGNGVVIHCDSDHFIVEGFGVGDLFTETLSADSAGVESSGEFVATTATVFIRLIHVGATGSNVTVVEYVHLHRVATGRRGKARGLLFDNLDRPLTRAPHD